MVISSRLGNGRHVLPLTIDRGPLTARNDVNEMRDAHLLPLAADDYGHKHLGGDAKDGRSA